MTPYIFNSTLSLIFFDICITPVKPSKGELTITVELPLWTQDRWDYTCTHHHKPSGGSSFSHLFEDIKLPESSAVKKSPEVSPFGSPPPQEAADSPFGTPPLRSMLDNNKFNQQAVLNELTQELERATKAGESEGYRAQLKSAIGICNEHMEGRAIQLDNSRRSLQMQLNIANDYSKTPERLQSFANKIKQWEDNIKQQEAQFFSDLTKLRSHIRR